MDAERHEAPKRANHQELAEQIRDGSFKPRWVETYRCARCRKRVGGLLVVDREFALYYLGGRRQDTRQARQRQAELVGKLSEWLRTGKRPAGEWPTWKETTINGVRQRVEPRRAELRQALRMAEDELAEIEETGNLTEPPTLRYIRWETGDRQVRPGRVESPCPRCHRLLEISITPDGSVFEH